VIDGVIVGRWLFYQYLTFIERTFGEQDIEALAAVCMANFLDVLSNTNTSSYQETLMCLDSISDVCK
jgi:hypothetical protein